MTEQPKHGRRKEKEPKPLDKVKKVKDLKLAIFNHAAMSAMQHKGS